MNDNGAPYRIVSATDSVVMMTIVNKALLHEGYVLAGPLVASGGVLFQPLIKADWPRMRENVP